MSDELAHVARAFLNKKATIGQLRQAVKVAEKGEGGKMRVPLTIEFFVKRLEGESKLSLENLYEHPNRAIPEWPSEFHVEERENVSEACVRILEARGHTPETSAAVAWQREPEKTRARYFAELGIGGAMPPRE